ncbi:MAG: hypothetical protein JKX68_13160 [Flavobacteriales bacterium]|nr:hypothetical protein [Flavobacteriales bacterium]
MEAPKIPSMFGFRSKKPDQFYFEPRYYDERKEKMKKRYASIDREVNNNPSFEKSHTDDFKSTIRENWGNSYSRSKAGNQMNRRVIIYVIALLALAYFILV